MALNLAYTGEMLAAIEEVLNNIAFRGGMVSSAFLNAELARLREKQYYHPLDCINIALVAMGKPPLGQGAATDGQMTALVERAKQRNRSVLKQIAVLREASASEKEMRRREKQKEHGI